MGLPGLKNEELHFHSKAKFGSFHYGEGGELGTCLIGHNSISEKLHELCSPNWLPE